jgi:hypothetical protein
MNTVLFKKSDSPIATGLEIPTGIDRAMRLDHATLAQKFAEQISNGRLEQIAEILKQKAMGRLHPVEALYKIQDIVNRKD